MPWFSTKGQIAQLIVAIGGLIFAGVKAYPEMKLYGFFSTTAILFYMLIVFVGFAALVSIQQGARYKAARKTSALAFWMLREKCDFLLRVYRQIKFDDPAKCKFPLSSSSWPSLDPPAVWTQIQLKLYDLSNQFGWFILMSRKAFEEIGWKDHVELFQLDRQRATIIELETALEAFKNLLSSKISSL